MHIPYNNIAKYDIIIVYDIIQDIIGGGNVGKIIAIANQKGGVGKTTTSVSLSAAIGKLGKKVLVVDMDPQGNTTSGYGINKRSMDISSYNVLMGERRIQEGIIKTKFDGVSVLGASSALAGAELELVDRTNRTTMLKRSLTMIKDNYDYIFIDCPPSLGLITLNCLTAADSVIIPMQCEFYSLEGLTQLIETIKLVKQRFNPGIEIMGILFTMYDTRLNVTVQVVREVKKFLGDKVFDTVIPRNIRLSEAPSFGEPIIYYNRVSKGAQAYMKLAMEILTKDGAKKRRPKR